MPLILEDSNKAELQNTALLAGVSYTLESGSTFSAEYEYRKDDPEITQIKGCDV